MKSCTSKPVREGLSHRHPAHHPTCVCARGSIKLIRCQATDGWYDGRAAGRDENQPGARPGSSSRSDDGWEPSDQGQRSYEQRPARSSFQRPVPRDSFMAMHDNLRNGGLKGFVINKEAWAKLFNVINCRDHANMSMELMLQDAGVRESNNWDWQTEGYGQTIFQLVKAAADARAYHAVDWVLSNAEPLHLTMGKDTIPNMMRKLVSVQADEGELLRLYNLEKSVRGSNTNAGFYELSRVYKKSGNVPALGELLTSAGVDGVALNEEMVEDIKAWLQKRS